MKKTHTFIILAVIVLLITGFVVYKYFVKTDDSSTAISNQTDSTENTAVNQTTTETPKTENKLCDWVDKSDIIIKVNIPEGVTPDTAYETGFYYSSIGSDMRLARSACDYRTGFSYAEMKGKGAVQVGVRGFSDSNRRQLVNEPISLDFDADGKPSIGSYIEVTIMN